MVLQIRALRFRVVKLTIDSSDSIDIGEKPFTLSLFNEIKGKNEIAISFDLKLNFQDVERSLQLIYAVDFEVLDSSDSEFVVSEDTRNHAFLMVNAPAISYPFVRSFVSTLSVNAGYAPVIMPAINFQKLYDDSRAKVEPQQLATN